MSDQRPARDQRPDVVSDLKYLRKSRGLTLDRLKNAEAVIRACGGYQQPTETVYERLLAALRSIQDAPGGRALWAAYGIEPGSADDLAERRKAHADVVGRAPYTVREWEDTALDELALRLLSAFYAGAPTPDKLPVPHGGLLIRSLSVTCVIRDRRFFESQQTREIISLVDGAKGFIYGTYSPTELSDGDGCTVSLHKSTPNGVLHKVMFPYPLARGQAHAFSFRERVPAEAVPAELPTEDFSGQTFESPALRYRVEVCFLGERPSTIWAFDKLSRIERPGEPEEGQLSPLGDGGLAAAEFHELYGGLCAGVAWMWGRN